MPWRRRSVLRRVAQDQANKLSMSCGYMGYSSRLQKGVGSVYERETTYNECKPYLFRPRATEDAAEGEPHDCQDEPYACLHGLDCDGRESTSKARDGGRRRRRPWERRLGIFVRERVGRFGRCCDVLREILLRSAGLGTVGAPVPVVKLSDNVLRSSRCAHCNTLCKNGLVLIF